jgi:hypothetical protein
VTAGRKKGSMSNFSCASTIYRKRIRHAQSVAFPGVEATSCNMLSKLVSAHADAIGCPKEFIFFPLLSAIAGKSPHKL